MDLNFTVTTNPKLFGLTLDVQDDNGGLLVKLTDLAKFTITVTPADQDLVKKLGEAVIAKVVKSLTDKVPDYVHNQVVGKSKKVADKLGFAFDAEGEKITLGASGLKFGTLGDLLLITGNVDVK